MTPVLFYPPLRNRNRTRYAIDPEIDEIVSQYCGSPLSEILELDESEFETGDIWSESVSRPMGFEKVLVEMLHLAYTRGEES